VEGKLAAETPEEAAAVKAADVSGLSLALESLIAWIKRLFSRR
jgi:hypothetical protein